VIVSGASGGVGIWCVQLAKKMYDCHVIGICSGRNADFVKDMGADEVIDYSKQDVAKTLLDGMPNGKKYDQYIDCVGGTEMFSHWVSGYLLCDEYPRDADDGRSTIYSILMALTLLSSVTRRIERLWVDL
jgi:threonine dehydrogenase-like Zn-dependent dehydrogenase